MVIRNFEESQRYNWWRERNVNSESFFRYSQYHSLNIDQTPLLNNIIYETLVDWQENDISFQLSPYFSHSLNYLIYSLNQTELFGE